MEEISSLVESYLSDWHEFAKSSGIDGLDKLKPMHFGWKVAEEADLIRIVGQLTPTSKLVNIARVDNRKLALLVTEPPFAGIPIAEIMQRRPGSADKLGLDHVAFWCPADFNLEPHLRGTSIKWEHQHNEGHAWISMWFSDKQWEAKFFDHTALDIAAKELHSASDKIKTS